MRKWTTGFIGLTLGTWALGLWLVPPVNGRDWSHELFFVTGVLAWGFMALCLVIACRPKWLERITGTPLDALYVHHRVLGWWALGLSFAHYFTKTWAQPVLSLFTLPKTPKISLAETSDFWVNLWRTLRPVANTSAEWLTWIMGFICLLAAVRVLRYQRWLTFHKLLSVVFLGLTLHCVRLMETIDFFTPFGWLNLIVTFAGSWAALHLLIKGPGRASLAGGTLTSSSTTGNVTQWTIKTPAAADVRPGQFVFVGYRGEMHPFSVTASTNESIELLIRHLGDFTTEIVPHVPEGESLAVEGPYGHFVPTFDGARQNWIAAGIGIAPFLAWLTEAEAGRDQAVTLHWCVRNADNEPLMEKVRTACRKAGVTLKIHDRRNGRVPAETLLAEKPERIALCGSTALRKSLQRAWTGSQSAFSVEHFAWRHSK